MREIGSDRGASAIDYAGLLVVVALILGSLVTIGIPGKVSDGLTPAICKIAGGTTCGGNADGARNTDGGESPAGDSPPELNRSPTASGQDPGLLSSLGRTLDDYWQGFLKFAGLKTNKCPNITGPFGGSNGKPHCVGFHPFNEGAGVLRELWEQVKGIGDFGKLAWCWTGACTHSAVKQARDTWSFIFNNPKEAVKQAGYAAIEPCLKAYRATNEKDVAYWGGRCETTLITTIVGAKGLGKLGKLSKLGKLGKLGKAAELTGKLKGLTRFTSDADRTARAAERAARSGNLTGARKYAAQAKRAADKARDALRRAGCAPIATGLDPPVHLGGRLSVAVKADDLSCRKGRVQDWQARKAARRAAREVAQAEAKSLRRQIRNAQLPTRGKVRYVPNRKISALIKVRGGGYADRFGNIWKKGPSRTPGEPFEWDVQLSKEQQKNWHWLLKSKGRKGTVTHLNVSQDGRITHVSEG